MQSISPIGIPEPPATPAHDPRGLVLVADDDPDIRRLVSMLLTFDGYDVVEARDGREALELTRARHPDLLLLDIAMPGLDGLSVCREIQAHGPGGPPVVFLTAKREPEARVTGLDAGAVDYIVKPFAAVELGARVRAALRARARQDQLAAAASEDALTRLVNRRQLDVRVAEAIALSRRSRPWACMMIDVDRFKTINDAHGHVAGDRVLVTLADRLRATVRASDVVGRYGGDEFVVLFETTPGSAATVAEKVWRALTQDAVPVDGGELRSPGSSSEAGDAIAVRVSVGVAVWDATIDAPEAFVAAADAAMYRAKQLGGNRVVAAGA